MRRLPLSAKTGKPALVIANEDAKPITVKATLNNGGKLSKYRLVDSPKWKPAKTIVIPGRSAAVVLPA